jgi:hypothetical protein
VRNLDQMEQYLLGWTAAILVNYLVVKGS